MGEKYLMGVDLGTSGTKAALYRTDGTMLSQSTCEVKIYYPQPGVVEQENEDFYLSAAKTVKECILESGINPKEIAGIAFDSQMAGIGSIDENYQPATRFDSWLDMRCKPYIEQLEKNYGNLITRLTGCPPTCDHGPKMLWWKNEHLEDYKHISRFVTPVAFVAGRMSGLKADQAFMDYTFIHFSGFSDSKENKWSDELCSTIGMDRDKLPNIVEPWRIIGEVTSQAASDFGLAIGTPIAAGAGDTAACALGAGIVRNGMLFDTAGTASILAGCTDKFIADEKHRALLCMHSVIPGLWNPLAYVAGGGLALSWFRDQFFNTNCGKTLPDDQNIYEQMITQAEKIDPGCNGLFFSPHLGGRICPAEPAMRGSWTGFSWGHTQAHFIRSILESIAFEYNYYLSILKENIPDLQLIETRVVGGGAQSNSWNQIKADVLGVPYQKLQRNELATWGSAMIAGYAVGIYSNLATTAWEHAVCNGFPIIPQFEKNEIYKKLSQQYVEWQKMFADEFHKLSI